MRQLMVEVAVGKKMPDFTLPDTDRKPRKLSEFQGKKLVLAFFPGTFMSVCTKRCVPSGISWLG
jgi:peroxiredoxin